MSQCETRLRWASLTSPPCVQIAHTLHEREATATMMLWRSKITSWKLKLYRRHFASIKNGWRQAAERSEKIKMLRWGFKLSAYLCASLCVHFRYLSYLLVSLCSLSLCIPSTQPRYATCTPQQQQHSERQQYDTQIGSLIAFPEGLGLKNFTLKSKNVFLLSVLILGRLLLFVPVCATQVP